MASCAYIATSQKRLQRPRKGQLETISHHQKCCQNVIWWLYCDIAKSLNGDIFAISPWRCYCYTCRVCCGYIVTLQKGRLATNFHHQRVSLRLYCDVAKRLTRRCYCYTCRVIATSRGSILRHIYPDHYILVTDINIYYKSCCTVI